MDRSQAPQRFPRQGLAKHPAEIKPIFDSAIC
jgi:hypothetical protein